MQVRLRADRLDLAGELDEEVSDLVEPVPVLPLDLAQAFLAPGTEVVMPAAGRPSGAEDGDERLVCLVGVL